MQERESALAVNFVTAEEKLDLGHFRDLQHAVDVADAGVFMGHPFIEADAVVVAAFNHERPRRDQPRHLGIIIGIAQVKFIHLVLAGEHVAALPEQRDVLPDPLIEVAGADDGAVTAQQRPDAHGHLAAVR